MAQLLKDEEVSITLFRGMEGLESLRNTWDDLVAGMAHRRFFHLWGWYYGYLACLAPDPNAMMFYLFTKRQTPMAIFPLQFTEISIGGLKLKALAFPPHNHMQLCDLICHDDALPLPLFELLSEHLRQQNIAFDLICLSHLLEDASALKAVHDRPPARFLLKHEGRCDYMDATGSHESFTAGLSKNFRRNLKRAKQYIDELPGVAFAFVQNGPGLEESFNAFLDVEASGWKGAQGSGTAIKLHPDLTCFYRTLTQTLSASGRVSINTLTADGKCIAAQFCILLNDTAYILKIGYDEGYKRYAPGNLLIDLFLRQSMEGSTLRAVNLITDAQWHEDWKPQSYDKSSLFIFNATLAGRIGFAILKSYPFFKRQYEAHIKPHLVSIRKRLFFALAATIFGVACAAYTVYASAQPLDFPSQDEKSLVSELETDSVTSGNSGWTLSVEAHAGMDWKALP